MTHTSNTPRTGSESLGTLNKIDRIKLTHTKIPPYKGVSQRPSKLIQMAYFSA